MAETEIRVRLRLEGLENFRSQLRSITDNAKTLGANINKLGSDVARFGRNVAVGAGVAGAAVATTVNEFVKFEDALIGAQKTTNLAGKDLDQFKANIEGMSTTLGSSQSELLAIAENAGVLGVSGVDNLTKFTETIAKFNVASSTLQGEEAATALARLIGVIGGDISDIDRTGSALAFLGDSVKATEADIAESAIRVAQSLAQFRPSEADVLGLAAAFSELGVRPELAGSSISKTVLEIQKVIASGGKEFEKLQEIVGLSATEIRQQFNEDQIGFFNTFVEGLQRTGQEGEALVLTLEDIGLTGVRINQVLPTLAVNQERVAQIMADSNRAFDENVKLTQEFELRAGALSFVLEQVRIAFQNIQITAGEQLAPGLRQLAAVFQQIIEIIGPVMQQIFADLNVRLTEFAQRVAEVIKQNPELIAQRVERFVRGIGSFLDASVAAFRILKNIFDGIALALTPFAAIFGLSGGEALIVLAVLKFSGALAVLSSTVGVLISGFKLFASVGGLASASLTVTLGPVIALVAAGIALGAAIGFLVEKFIGWENVLAFVGDFLENTLIPAILNVSKALFDTFITGIDWIIDKAKEFGAGLVNFLFPADGGIQQGLENLFNAFSNFGQRVIEFFQTHLPPGILDALSGLGDALTGLFDAVFGLIIDSFEATIRTITAGINGLTKLIQGIRQTASDVVSGVQNAASAVGRAARAVTSSSNDNSRERTFNFAQGGKVSGPGTGTSDSIMARLSNGEFVMRAAAVRKFGADFFNLLNRGVLPSMRGFADGGLVEAIGNAVTSGGLDFNMGSRVAAVSASPSGRPIVLNLPGGGQIRAITDEDTARRLARDLNRSDNAKSGKLPGWY